MTQTTAPSPLHHRVTGPNQLMSLLHNPQTSDEHVELLEVWLSKDSECISFDAHPLSLENCEIPELHHQNVETSDSLIVILNIQNQYLTRTSIPNEYQLLLSRIRAIADESGLKILDLIIATNSRWWSTLCHSDECCPEVGRIRDTGDQRQTTPATETQNIAMSRQKAWQLISAMVENFDLSYAAESTKPTDEQASRVDEVLLILEVFVDDITFRDCILSHCSKDFKIQSRWTHLLELCLLRPTLNRVSVITILSSLAYLKYDLLKAQELLDRAFEIDSTYSLARLLQQGLTTKAPPSLLASAFSVHSPAELLEKSRK